jgi:uncharacterized membrane protein YphA (DoxX/SURF4 family)
MERVRAADTIIIRVLSVALAVLFFLTGLAKILGGLPMLPVLQAAAMTDFPAWVRIMVGVFEVTCGVLLLVPAAATVAALVLAGFMLPATAIRYMSDGRYVWVPPLLMAALVLLAWRRNAQYVTDEYTRYSRRPHPLARDAVVAGLIGAMTIAVWFLVIDTVAGRPFHTPMVLGRGLFSVFGPDSPDESAATLVLGYTVFHFAAFLLVGWIASLVVHAARTEPSVLFAFVMLFAAFEVGIYGLVAVLDIGTPLGRYAWLQIMTANLLAATAMGWYFWRTHRELGDEFRHSLDWEQPAQSGTPGYVPPEADRTPAMSGPAATPSRTSDPRLPPDGSA